MLEIATVATVAAALNHVGEIATEAPQSVYTPEAVTSCPSAAASTPPHEVVVHAPVLSQVLPARVLLGHAAVADAAAAAVAYGASQDGGDGTIREVAPNVRMPASLSETGQMLAAEFEHPAREKAAGANEGAGTKLPAKGVANRAKTNTAATATNLRCSNRSTAKNNDIRW